MDGDKGLTLYQVGDLVLRIDAQEWHGYKSQAKYSTERMLYSNQYVFSNAPRVVEPRQITVTGNLRSLSHTIQEFEAMAHSLENTITDLIAYQTIDCCNDDNCCGCDNDWQDIIWWQNSGLIIDISLSQNDNQSMNISITFVMQATWQPVNRFIWSWQNRKKSFWADTEPQKSERTLIVQVNVADFTANFTNGIREAQSFIFPQTAQISRFDIWWDTVGNGPVIWEIRAGSSTTGPSSTLLKTGSFYPSFGQNIIRVDNGPLIQYGQPYFIVFYPQIDFSGAHGVLVSSTNPYANGNRWSTTDNGSTWSVPGSSNDLRFAVYAGYTYQPTLRPYPTIEDILSDNCRALWVRRNYSARTLLYEPDVWEILHLYHRTGVPRTGYGTNWQNSYRTFIVPSKRDLFSVEPTSLYAFTNINPLSNILIAVERYRTDIWRAKRFDTSIDVIGTSADMVAAGHTALTANDVIIIGDTPTKPGFIIRNGQILSNVAPTVTYPGAFPGELGPGNNKITIALSSNQISYAQLHTFRRL